MWREIQTLLKENMDALGVRLDFRSVPVQDLFKEAAQGKFVLNIHGRSATPQRHSSSRRSTGRSRREANESRFRSEPYDRALDAFFVRGHATPRARRAARTMTEILQSYAPVMPLLVDVENAFVQPWLLGYYPSPFSAYFQYMDIAPSKRAVGGSGTIAVFARQKQHHARFEVLSLHAEGSARRGRRRRASS